jgi:lipoprotein-releasing system ATP-binding protein
MSENTLEAKNLHKTFHHPVKAKILKGVSLFVRRGETVAIMGRSGEGKSTLLNILGTLEMPCEGSITISGHDVSRYSKTAIRNKHVGFVFQSFHLLEDYTVLENILMPARIARKSVHIGSAAFQKGCRLLEQVGLSERAGFNAKQLSGGEKQRVTIARALCNDPDIIFADEPSGNLDRQNAASIHDLLLGFARKENKSLVVVTHDHELAKLCDTRYQLIDGRLEYLQ